MLAWSRISISVAKKKNEKKQKKKNETKEINFQQFFVHDIFSSLYYMLLLVFIGRWQLLHVIENDDFGEHRNVLESILSPTTLGNIDGERHIEMV